jgi:hypothetical protein
MRTTPVEFVAPVIHCGTSDSKWQTFPELSGRHCILEAGHTGFHIAQRDDETHADTMRRCSPEPGGHIAE